MMSDAGDSYRSTASRLISCRERDPKAFEVAFRCLDAGNLAWLEGELGINNKDHSNGTESSVDRTKEVIAEAILRRISHHVCTKQDATRQTGSDLSLEEVLSLHPLPSELSEKLSETYGGTFPLNWWQALQRLQFLSEGSKERLWEMIESHPMTSYVPAQCQTCGDIVPDNRDDKSDDEVGLVEVSPTDEERPYVCGGWFRGPRDAVVFELHCPVCGATSRWYRSSSPSVILNPNRWGRLCGEQETLKKYLANALDIETRIVVPLDWDHVWSEMHFHNAWRALDPNARNFASRLDEGIGAWTHVLALSTNPLQCDDITDAYLACASEGGRMDTERASEISRWKARVEEVRMDNTGLLTQARTLNGYVLREAQFSSQKIASVLQRAVADYGIKPWWDIGSDTQSDCKD
eukprot:CAMPEP_0195521582 /NCGR_PEP_ID=MMETSP0794_2-20130614/18975_1 /TAXON_ID=515487 /ORGANISM="Stephanopyxis turris, Strain CCMP 815" /LENGTH=406 /DNA_ID=CAMNT_0040651163 /DNA_START=84 /DNA_END=1304 /DNA_ORIENTATION=+